MNILITGGTGFIGARLVNRLSRSGHHLFLTTRNSNKYKDKLPSQVKFIEWNTLSQDFPIQALPSSLDGVINLMGENIANKRWSQTQKIKLKKSRIHATRKLINALEKAKLHPSFFINASAIGYYPVNQEQELDEDSAKGQGFLSDLCHEWEQTLTLLPDPIRKSIIRIGVVLGPEAGAMSKLLPLFKVGVGGPVGIGHQVMSWIHIEDLIKAIKTIVENESYSGIFNLVSPRPATNKEFTKALGKALNRPTFFMVPPQALRLAMGEMATIVLDGQIVLPKALQQKGFQFDHPDINEAIANLLKK